MSNAPMLTDPRYSRKEKQDGEAATAITDGLMAVQCAWYAYRLGRDHGCGTRALQCWRGALASVGLAAAAGAGFHGLPPHVWPRLRAALWKAVGIATGAAGALMLVGGILASSTSAWRQLWIAAALVKSVLLGVNTWQRNDFRTIIYDYGASLVALFLLQWRWPSPASPAIRHGILFSCVAVAVQQKGPVLHPRFDRNALYHLVQMVALHFFAQAGRKLCDSAPAADHESMR
jgi:hypothetical protein